ncbi:hypothetical protein FCM35_KLT04126 [Carex littledalei]|uniref:Uncharacterized protein n=1 Tax=Carex littledalei TaxID=544730 RepID=A0A833R1X9_9POAL|nr:hypothetical protein FCM35_KLT04126 [Carex littledalei]
MPCSSPSLIVFSGELSSKKTFYQSNLNLNLDKRNGMHKIVEGEDPLWDGVSRLYRETIRLVSPESLATRDFSANASS